MSTREHIKWFRDSSPYIDAHREKTFVIHLSGEAFACANLSNILSDIALLNALGARVLLAHGARRQIKQALDAAGLGLDMVENTPIIRPEAVDLVTAAVSVNRTRLEAGLSRGSTNTPVKGREIRTLSGNFVKAKPLGIVDGVDFHNTGATRKVDVAGISSSLDDGAIVIVSGISHSPSGETFNLPSATMARDLATSMGADKLIYFIEAAGIADTEGKTVSEIDLSSTADISDSLSPETSRTLEYCREACNAGVDRAHIISHHRDGALLEELFTRDGCGTQVTGKSYEQVREATIDDVAGILKLIEPLERQGLLVERPRELIESEIGHFHVIERDGLLISCGALYPFDRCGELACLVTHPDYRQGMRGERLLDVIEKTARDLGLTRLFVLTTRSTDWFREHGFKDSDLRSLPEGKRNFYNYRRNSKVLEKALRAFDTEL